MASWHMHGTMLEFCNCEPSCGCNFRGFPSSPDGSCQGLAVYAAEEGSYEGLDLAGATVVWALF